MQSKELLQLNLKMTQEMTLPLLEKMKDAPLTFPTPKGGNHPLWVLGHLTYSESDIIQAIMLGKSNPLADWKDIFSYGTEPVGDAATYPSFDEVMTKYQQVRKDTLALLDSLSEDDLDAQSKSCDPSHADFFGTYRRCFLLIANHSVMHRGQVADAKRAAGL